MAGSLPDDWLVATVVAIRKPGVGLSGIAGDWRYPFTYPKR
jgi:hypothetical protein